MGDMILSLVTVSQRTEMFFSSTKVIFGTASHPLIIWVSCNAISHNAGDDFKRLIEWFH